MTTTRFPHFSVRARLLLGIVAMMLPLMMMALGSAHYLRKALASFDEVVEDPISETRSVSRLQMLLLRAAQSVAHSRVSSAGWEDRERIQASVAGGFENVLAIPFLTSQQRALVEQAEQEWERAADAISSTLAAADPRALTSTETERAISHMNRATNVLDQVHELVEQEISEQLAAARGARTQLLFGILGLFAAASLVAVAISVVLARSIIRPLRLLETAAERFGHGDLAHRAAVPTHDELSDLATAFNDMADRLRNHQEALTELSSRDGLTGLFNHREFQKRLAEECARGRRYARPLSLLMLDLDHFKDVNDTWGHQVGDEVLRSVAHLLSRKVRSVDYPARYGGEEFCVILPESTAEAATVVAQNIREAVEKNVIDMDSEKSIHITVSIGVAAFPSDARSNDALIVAADRALYAAKHRGRNRVVAYSADVGSIQTHSDPGGA